MALKEYIIDKHNFIKQVKKLKDLQETGEELVKKKRFYSEELKKESVNERKDTGNK